MPDKGPSASKVLAVLAILPAGGTLALAVITFLLSLIGLTIATPVFILFSLIIIPAAIDRVPNVWGVWSYHTIVSVPRCGLHKAGYGAVAVSRADGGAGQAKDAGDCRVHWAEDQGDRAADPE
ncbi:hypothetical protein MLD38_000148 [Melastoma candidum]|uniref:Uncharacterized protein n=1 Tax=Melastoma candidum TaxID=119954 RepID=A0ACB9SHS1_9MYRT|nr:hypothetical protein MLD38_000148 [Melastoma candidum]